LTVLITGAAAGLGAAFARRFAQAGSRVIATGRREQRLVALKRELGERSHTVVLDVRDRRAVESMVPPCRGNSQTSTLRLPTLGSRSGSSPRTVSLALPRLGADWGTAFFMPQLLPRDGRSVSPQSRGPE
jgi:NAD(P)-dependent dehydrogenase (short-subunit alcohol dehydrogenase family)